MAGAAPLTAVRWFWHTGEEFAPFDPRVNASLERQYEDVKRIASPTPEQLRLRLDDERYIDINFKTELEIKRHFRGLDEEVGLIGLQRRYDDPMKRRAIKRDATLFAGTDLVLTGPPDARVQSLAAAAVVASARLVQLEGADLAKAVFIARAGFAGPRDASLPLTVAVVSAEWIHACIQAGARLPTQLHVLLPGAEPAAVAKRSTPLLSSDNDTPPLPAKKARADTAAAAGGALTEVAALPMQLAAGTQLAGLSLATAGDDDEPSVHCSVVFTHVGPLEGNAQTLAGLMTWATDGTVTQRTLFAGSVLLSDPKRRVLRLQENEVVWGGNDAGRRVWEGRVNRADCRLFSQDRARQLALLPVPADRTAFVGAVSSPVLLQITHSAPPRFAALLLYPQGGDRGAPASEEVTGTLTADEIAIDAPQTRGRLRAVAGAEGVYEGSVQWAQRQVTMRLRVAGS